MKRIKRVFVANRGEIALRIVNACEELGLETVVGTSDADRRRAGRAPRRPGGVHRAGPGRRQLPARRPGRAGGARHRLRRDPSRLRLPVGEPEARGARARERTDVHRPPARGHGAERRQAPRARGGGARRRAGPPRSGNRIRIDDARRQPRPDRLSAAGQGGRRRRRPRDQARARRRRARQPARPRAQRGGRGVRRRPRVPRAVRRRARATSRSRSPPTSTARSSTSASATARCSAATRR